jgi:hypothetical protein
MGNGNNKSSRRSRHNKDVAMSLLWDPDDCSDNLVVFDNGSKVRKPILTQFKVNANNYLGRDYKTAFDNYSHSAIISSVILHFIQSKSSYDLSF